MFLNLKWIHLDVVSLEPFMLLLCPHVGATMGLLHLFSTPSPPGLDYIRVFCPPTTKLCLLGKTENLAGLLPLRIGFKPLMNHKFTSSTPRPNQKNLRKQQESLEAPQHDAGYLYQTRVDRFLLSGSMTWFCFFGLMPTMPAGLPRDFLSARAEETKIWHEVELSDENYFIYFRVSNFFFLFVFI